MCLCNRALYGLIYVRHEYPLAVKNLGIAIKAGRRTRTAWQENTWQSGLDFTLDIREGKVAFVCGESTALIASLEGERRLTALCQL